MSSSPASPPASPSPDEAPSDSPIVETSVAETSPESSSSSDARTSSDPEDVGSALSSDPDPEGVGAASATEPEAASATEPEAASATEPEAAWAWLQNCEDSGNAGQLGCRNARAVATQYGYSNKCEESRARPLSSPNFPSRKAAIPMLLVDIGVVSMDFS